MNKALEWIKGAKSYFAKEIRTFGGGNITPTQNLPFLPNWMHAAKLGMPRQINIVELRQYAKSCWVQMVVNAISKQIMTTEWVIITEDESKESQEKYSADIKKITTFLNQPNRNGDSFWDVWIPFLRDVLELDSGVIYKGRNLAGELVELFAYDGARFLVNVNEYGIIGEDSKGEPTNGYYQYSFRQISAAPVPFEKDEIIYGRMNTNSELFPYGFSPLQSIQQEVELMIQSTRFNKERFSNSAVPDGIVSVPMDKDQMMQFRNAWENEVKGRPHKLIFHNSEASFTPLSMTNKDMEWLEGQKWYFHLVFAAYGLSPQEVGFYENSNRSTGESQERITIKNAIKPYLTLISNKINREIIPDLVQHDELNFKWILKDDVAEKVEHDQMMSKLNANVLTINEVRAMEGLDPVEWGDQPISMVMQDRFIERDEEIKPEPKDRDESKEKAEENKSFSKKLDPGKDIIDESKDYEDFLKKRFNHWETEIFKFLDRTLEDELLKDVKYMEKSFGEFIQELFNRVNTVGFRKGLIATIKSTMKKSVDEVELELNVDIGFSPEMTKEANKLTDRQLEGFYIEGKRWKGLKGVAEDVQLEVSQIVRDGIVDKKGISEIKKQIKERLDVTKTRAEKIARTETTRFSNHAKLKSYQESGLVDSVIWDSHLDNRTSDICEKLNNQTVSLGSFFSVDTEKGLVEFSQPPAHTNCRSVLRPVLKKVD